ncbi:MAG: hypothetical protein FWG05_02225 [Kiritimatiellaeota bacterium]|nr:hypothetical protein [Kiritimatiellota bacterium]
MKTHIVFSLAALAIPAALIAQETAPAAETEAAPAVTLEKLENNVNTLGETIRLKVDKQIANNKKLVNAWDNPEFTSDEVEAKRKELKDLQNAVIKAQIELREEVANLPAVKALSDENAKLDTEIKTLRADFNTKVRELRMKRFNQTATE